jgi:ABC-2 type transport system ATP-binding protein
MSLSLGPGGMQRRDFVQAATGAAFALPFANAATAADGTVHTHDRRIASFDGQEIASTVFLPPGDGQHPVVMATHGWGGDRSSVAGYGQFFAKQGYVVITWDQRGFGESDGEVDVSGPKESRDGSALLDFLAGTHPDSEAEIVARVAGGDDPPTGMIGGSYGGGIQLNVAAIDERVDALFPIIPWHDLRYSLTPDASTDPDVVSNVPKLGWVSLLQATGATGARGLTSGDSQPDQGDIERGLNTRLHEFYAKSVARNDMPAEGLAYFAVRSTVAKADRIGADALVVQGWPDTLFVPNEGQRIVRDLNANAHPNEAKLLFYNGGHTLVGNGGTSEFSMEETALQWFDAKLKGVNGGDDGFAPVTYYDVQAGMDADGPAVSAADAGTFLESDAFPPSSATGVDLSLADAAGSGSTRLANSVAPTSTSQVAPPNRDFASGATAADFDFTVDEAVELATTPTLTAEVTPLGTRAFLFAKVSHVSGGEATLINNQAIPTAVEGEPGTAREVELELVSFHRRFAAGDTIRLTLATTDAGFANARQAAGLEVNHDASTLRLHATDGADALGRTGDDGGGDGGSGDDGDVEVSVTRTDDGDVFTGGATNQVDLTVEADRPVFVRDRTPLGWRVVGGDPHDRTAPPETGENYVAFRQAAESKTFTYFAEAPASAGESGHATFGPVEYSLDGETWTTLSGTSDENVLLGVGSGSPL